MDLIGVIVGENEIGLLIKIDLYFQILHLGCALNIVLHKLFTKSTSAVIYSPTYKYLSDNQKLVIPMAFLLTMNT